MLGSTRYCKRAAGTSRYHAAFCCERLPRTEAIIRGTWCSGITSASHAEGPGLKSQCFQKLHCRVVGKTGNTLTKHMPRAIDRASPQPNCNLCPGVAQCSPDIGTVANSGQGRHLRWLPTHVHPENHVHRYAAGMGYVGARCVLYTCRRDITLPCCSLL